MRYPPLTSLIVLLVAFPAWAQDKPEASPKEPKSAEADKPVRPERPDRSDRPHRPPRPDDGSFRDRMLDRAFEALDANGDGSIDAEEFRGRFPRLVERVRDEVHRRMERLPSPEEIQRWIDERVGDALDRARDRFADRPPPPPPGERGPGRGRGFGAKPPLSGPIFRDGPRPGDERPDRFRDGPRDRRGRDTFRRGRGGPDGRGPMMLMKLFDADKNGAIDEPEIDQAPQALKKLDADDDGRITPREIHASIARQMKKGDKASRRGKGKRPERKPEP